MIINREGAQFTHEGVTYTIGDKIIATNASDYEGLYGLIKEIRTGEDRETGNDTPDIHCQFYPPFDHREITRLESRFSSLYRSPKKLEEIALDEVIMAPEMIRLIFPANSTRIITAYILEIDEVMDGYHCPKETMFFLDEDQARMEMTARIRLEMEEGCINPWLTNPKFDSVVTSWFYQCWLDDAFADNHYQADIRTEQICLSSEMFESIGRRYVDGILRKHFAEQIEDWEELEDLNEEQISEMITAPHVPERIKKQLNENGYLIESYWESVSEASFDLVKKYRMSKGLPARPND